MPRARLPLCLLLLPLLLGGCIHSGRAFCPGEGGPAWRELSSTHFRMRTDLEAADAGETLVQLERYRRALLLAWSGDFDPPGRVDVVVLRSGGELEEFVPEQFAAMAVTRERGPLLLLAGTGGEAMGGGTDAASAPLHELVHHLSRFAMPQQPRWLGEGFAMYLQTATISDDGQRVKIGRAAAPWIAWARSQRVLGLHQLWEWDAVAPEGEDLTQLYVSSWLWVHYLMNNHQQRFADFQTRLAAMEPARAAFAAAFAGAEWDEEEHKLQEYMFDGHYVVLDFALPAVDTRASERELEPAEIHALRAELYALDLRDLPAQRQASALRAELDVARREAPAAFHTALMEATYVQEGADPLAPARALVAAHPGRKEAWALLSERLVTHPATFEERETALRRALELAPEDPFLLGLLAWTYVSERQPQKALSPSARAVRLSPWSASALDTYAAALAGVGRCPEAHSIQLQATSALTDSASPEARRQFQARLATYERCAKPAAHTPR